MLFILVKASLVSTHASHFAGGKHAFCCMADTLAAIGHQVHVVCAASKAQLLVAAMQGGHAAPDLASITAATPGGTSTYEVVQWTHPVPNQLCDCIQASIQQQQQQQQQHPNVTFHAVLRDAYSNSAAEAPEPAEDNEAQARTSTWQTALARHVQQIAQQPGVHATAAVTPVTVIIDADDSQLQPIRSSSACGSATAGGAAGASGQVCSSDICKAVVCGRCTQQPRALQSQQPGDDLPGNRHPALPLVLSTPMQQPSQQLQPSQSATVNGMQQAMDANISSLFEQVVSAAQLRTATVIALVQNVHFLPFGPSGTSARTTGLLKAWQSLDGILCVSQFVHDYVKQHAACNSPDFPTVHVTKLNAWGCFGLEPYEDLHEQAVRKLSANGKQPSQQQSSMAAPKRPVIGVLKLTPEKGCSIIHQLAMRTVEQYNWLLVSGDPAVHQLFQGMRNVKVIDPQPDVGTVLRAVCCVLVPSLWLEAWGMVVIDSLLRGIPVIVSDAGALHESGLGVCPVVHVEPIIIPPCAVCGTPTWAARQYPRQQVQPWEHATQQLLADVDAFKQSAQSCRREALRFCQQQPQQLQSFLSWLDTLS